MDAEHFSALAARQMINNVRKLTTPGEERLVFEIYKERPWRFTFDGRQLQLLILPGGRTDEQHDIRWLPGVQLLVDQPCQQIGVTSTLLQNLIRDRSQLELAGGPHEFV